MIPQASRQVKEVCCFWKVLRNGITGPIWWWKSFPDLREAFWSRRVSATIPTAPWMAMAYTAGTLSVLAQTFVFMNVLPTQKP